jgi:hypothetical protein
MTSVRMSYLRDVTKHILVASDILNRYVRDQMAEYPSGSECDDLDQHIADLQRLMIELDDASQSLKRDLV